jgi:ubiquitin-like-conjugating enzyme ATG3
MKKVIERMNAGVVEEQRKASSPASPAKSDNGKKKWLGGVVKKTASPTKEEDVEGMRVDFYLVVFLKFIASIVPTIEVDSTASF